MNKDRIQHLAGIQLNEGTNPLHKAILQAYINNLGFHQQHDDGGPLLLPYNVRMDLIDDFIAPILIKNSNIDIAYWPVDETLVKQANLALYKAEKAVLNLIAEILTKNLHNL